MKPGEGKALFNDCIKRGWIYDKKTNHVYTPAEALSFNLKPEKKRKAKTARTYDTNDHLNIANKAKHCDQFTRLLEIELKINVWPEYAFAVGRKWRFDYCLPELKIAIEQEGGVYSGGRHTRGKGFEADMEKYNYAAADGWTLIRRTPSQLLTAETIDLIKKAIGNISKNA